MGKRGVPWERRAGDPHATWTSVRPKSQASPALDKSLSDRLRLGLPCDASKLGRKGLDLRVLDVKGHSNLRVELFQNGRFIPFWSSLSSCSYPERSSQGTGEKDIFDFDGPNLGQSSLGQGQRRIQGRLPAHG